MGNWNIEPRSCRHQNNQRDKTLTTQFALSKTLLPRICQIPNEEVEFPGGRVSPALPAAGFQGRVRGHLAEVAALESYGTRWQEHKSIFLLLTLSLLRCIEILESSLFPHLVTQHELTHILNYFLIPCKCPRWLDFSSVAWRGWINHQSAYPFEHTYWDGLNYHSQVVGMLQASSGGSNKQQEEQISPNLGTAI